MYVIDGILNDTWCSTEDNFVNVLNALSPMMTSALAVQVQDYLDSNAPKNTVFISALNKTIKPLIDTYMNISDIFKSGVLDQALGVNYRALYYVVKAGATHSGHDIDKLRVSCAALSDIGVNTISDSVVVPTKAVDIYMETLKTNVSPEYLNEAVCCVRDNKVALIHGENSTKLRALKRVSSDIKWIAKSLDYMDKVGITSGTEEEGRVFNFAYA